MQKDTKGYQSLVALEFALCTEALHRDMERELASSA